MSHPKTRQVGTAGLVTRYRNGICISSCRRCHQADTPPSWRAALRDARAHARHHQTSDARDVGTPWGIPAHELPRPAARPAARPAHPLRRLAIAVVILALTALLLPALLGPLTSHAAPAPTTTISSTTSPAAPEGYVPTLAGPPATDSGGQWIPEPNPSSAPTSSSAGGGR
jgi:hypothetical protein